MKSLYGKSLTLAFVAFFYIQLAQAQVVITGKQSKVSGATNKLEGKCIKITEAMRITKVEGANAGFWVQNGTSIVLKFWKPNDPTSIGKVLQPGDYYIYPNIPNGAKEATVKVLLQ